MPIENLIFDLDGTLIDSSNSILESFRGAFEEVGKEPVCPLKADIIGPPLREALCQLSGSSDSEELDRLATAFKAHYDTEGYKSPRSFQMLRKCCLNCQECNFRYILRLTSEPNRPV
ncbi:MAG: HAD family hydrolase [Methylomicrobium sp.]